jgi:uncharacterized protein YbaA (DUF1428 family)
MKNYIDGFVIPIPPDKIPEYQSIATLASKIWKEHGALEYIEAVGDDLKACLPDGKSPTELLGARPGETLVFAYIVYESREHRDAVNTKVMADPRMKEICPDQNPEATLPFDPQRMITGGFKTIVSA